MLKSLSKIKRLGYKLNIERRCKIFNVPIMKKGKTWKLIDERYIPILLDRVTRKQIYIMIVDWIYDFTDDTDLRDALYTELVKMNYNELVRFLILKEII